MKIIYPGIKPDRTVWRAVLGAPPQSTWTEMVSATAKDEFQRLFTPSMIRKAELAAAEGKYTIEGFESDLNRDELIDRARELNRDKRFIPQYAESIMPYLSVKEIPESERAGKFLSEEEWKESEYYDPELSFPKGVKEDVARIIKERKIEERKRRDIISRAPRGPVAAGTMLATSLLTHLLDPLEVAASFVPVVSEARYAIWATRHGKTLARLGKGAIEGLAGAGMIEPMVYSASQQEQADYGMTESLLNIGFGAIFGGGLHTGMGAIGDMLKKARPWTREAALRSAVARFVEGKEPRIVHIINADDKIAGEHPRLNRWDVKEQLKNAFDLSNEETDAAMALIDTRAAIWAEKTGKSADDYYGEWIAGIERGGDPAIDALFMATKKIDTKDPDWKAGKDHGNMKAAEQYAEKTWTKRKTTYALKKINDPENTLLISQVGSSRNNIHPIALARKLANETGAEYVNGDQYFIPLHKEQSKHIPIEDRIFNERIYEPVNIEELKAKAKGKEIILIEDKITTGGSNRAFIKELRKHGIKVKSIIAYEGYYRPHIYERNITEIQRLLDKKNLKFNAGELENKLTDGEAYALIRKLQRTKDGQKELTEKIQGLFDRRTFEDVPANKDIAYPGRDTKGKDIGDGTSTERIQDSSGLPGTLEPAQKTTPDQLKLFQESEDAIRASIEFIEDGRALIRAIENPDISSMLHEIGHLFRKEIGITEPRLLAEIEGWAGVENGKWTTINEERFVDGFMEYLKEGKAPSDSIQSLFEKFKKWLSDIYIQIRKTDADLKINDDVRKFFDGILGKEEKESRIGKREPDRIDMEAIAKEIQAREDDFLDTDPDLSDLKPEDLKPLKETNRATGLKQEIEIMSEDIKLLEDQGLLNEEEIQELSKYDRILNKTEEYRRAARNFANCLT